MAQDTPPRKPVTLLGSELSEMSKNETLKAESQGLFWVAGKTKHSFRSEIEDLTEGRAPTLSNEAKEISKHFGIYKQQERIEGRKSHNYIFMVRMRVPAGGEFSAQQWEALCEASDRFADGSLRLTTRQAVQFHYIGAPALGPLIRFLNRTYPSSGYQMSTLAACGDVNRNTMCSVVDDLIPELPLASRELAYAIAMELAPRSSAYYQVFLSRRSWPAAGASSSSATRPAGARRRSPATSRSTARSTCRASSRWRSRTRSTTRSTCSPTTWASCRW